MTRPMFREAFSVGVHDESPYSETYYGEPQSRIDVCLRCMKSECCNCFGGNTHESQGRPRANIDLDELKRLLDLGTPTPQICKQLATSKSTIIRLKRKMKERKQYASK